jgi:hypothetical protein
VILSSFCFSLASFFSLLFHFVSLLLFLLLFFCTVGTNPGNWIDRFVGSEIWSLYSFITLSSHRCSARVIKRSPYIFSFLYHLTAYETIEGLVGMIILFNLYLHNAEEASEGEETVFPLTDSERDLLINILQTRKHLFPLLFNVYQLTLSGDQSSSLFTSMSAKGYSFGMIRIHILTLTLKNIASLKSTYHVTLLPYQWQLKPLITKTLSLFTENAAECITKVAYSNEEGGGGGKDYEAIEYLLEMLLYIQRYEMTGGEDPEEKVMEMKERSRCDRDSTYDEAAVEEKTFLRENLTSSSNSSVSSLFGGRTTVIKIRHSPSKPSSLFGESWSKKFNMLSLSKGRKPEISGKSDHQMFHVSQFESQLYSFYDIDDERKTEIPKKIFQLCDLIVTNIV